MEKITTFQELVKAALPLNPDDILINASGHAKKLSARMWRYIRKNSFNTSNGILAFVDDKHKLYVIQNFDGLVTILENEHFFQDYIMPVPLANGSSPRKNHAYWESLQDKFRGQYSA